MTRAYNSSFLNMHNFHELLHVATAFLTQASQIIAKPVPLTLLNKYKYHVT